MEALGLHGPRKSKPRVKSELCKQQFLTTIIWYTQEFLGKYKNSCVTVQFCLILFEFEGNIQVQAPEGLYSEGRFNGGIFALRVEGAYTWRGLFSNFYGI